MIPQDTKKVLIDRNLTAAEIARRIGASPSQVHQVINWHRRTPWIRRGIAKELNIPYSLMWREEDPGVDHLPRGRRPRSASQIVHKRTNIASTPTDKQ